MTGKDLAPVAKDAAIEEMKKECEEQVNTHAPGTIEHTAWSHLKMSIHYYQDVRDQAQQSFDAALRIAYGGAVFLLVAVAALLVPMGTIGDRVEVATVSAISGFIIEFISGINFYLYFRTARQFSSFHICLERTNRFLLASSMCEKVSCPTVRNSVFAELVRLVANAPMLTLEQSGISGVSRTVTTSVRHDESLISSMPEVATAKAQPVNGGRQSAESMPS